MPRLNDNYLKLSAGYLFPEISRRVQAYSDANPDAASRLIRCGIGDVTEPIPAAAVAALKRGADDLGSRDAFRGYPPATGYDFVRKAIAEHDPAIEFNRTLVLKEQIRVQPFSDLVSFAQNR